MPIHDWTRVNAGTFHHFHVSWITEIARALNAGLLPPDYYAMAEQLAGGIGPDVLTLQAPRPEANGAAAEDPPGGGIAVATAPPRTRFVLRKEEDKYAEKSRSIVIHHSSGDQVVALIEILSPGKKSSRHGVRSFLEKAYTALRAGYHLLLVDLFPPGPRDPQGIHGALWTEYFEEGFTLPPDKPLTLAAYAAGEVKTAYVEPVAVGDSLPDMPLFLTPEVYVPVPLETTYQASWQAVPRRWRRELEGGA
jgi:hypothetical protein